MSTAELHQLFEQRTRTLKRHPSLGKTCVQASVKLVSTLACESRGGHRVTRVDLPVEEGGTETGPTPGDLMRASLGACMAMGYRQWGARLGVDIRSVEVEVTCELDARGQLGISEEVPVGWERLLLDIRITTTASAADVRRVVEIADRLSPMLSNLSPAIERAHALTISRIEDTTTTLTKDMP